MPSVLDLNLAKRQEVPKLEKGEHELRIVGADAVLNKDRDETVNDPTYKGRRIQLRCESADNPMADDVYHTLWLPHEEDTDKSRNKKLNVIADFMDKIGLDPDVSSLDLTEWIGCSFTAMVEVDAEGNVNIKQVFKA
jgi:hypothetical protein